MEELIRILSLPIEKRTASDLAYLEAHKDELTEEQKTQLEDEKKPVDVVEESVLKKNIGQKVFKQFETVIKENSDGTLRAIVNSGQEDRHGEILDIKGLDIKKYMTNPILAYSHDYTHPSVGRTLKLTKTRDGKLESDFKFATDVDDYPMPKILDQLYRKGYQFAFSIGFIPQEVEGNKYTKAEMIEFSPVLIGADAQALLKSKELLKKKGIDTAIKSSYNYKHMYKLEDILSKTLEELTLGEVKFLKENISKLSDEDKAKFKDVLEDKESGVIKAVEALIAPMKKDIEEIKAADPVIVKNINGQAENKNININKNKEYTKEQKFLYYVRGVQSKNFSQYENVVGKDAMNTTDDGVVLPPVEFIAEVERLEEEYGVARQFATIKRTERGAGVKYLLGDDDLEIFDTAEAGRKKSTKLSYQEKLLTFRKYAGILPMTDELGEDSAIDLWSDATRRFARAYAKKEDENVFIRQAGSGNLFPGVVHAPGVHEVIVDGDSIEDTVAEDLNKMIYAVPTASAANGRFYIHRTILGVIQRLRDGDERTAIWQPSPAQGMPPTIWGKPYTLVETLPSLDDDDGNVPFAIFGDLRYVTMGERTQLVMKMFDTGMVGDPDEDDQGDDLNLLTQDMTALRAVKRMNSVVRFPEAFSVLKTNDQS